MLLDLVTVLKRLRWIPERNMDRRAKKCSRCHEVKDLRSFATLPSGVYQTFCKACQKDAGKRR